MNQIKITQLLDLINFKDIISSSSCYGIIFSGEYDSYDVAIKMTVLTSGIHFNHKANTYQDGLNVLDIMPAIFNENNEIPFVHSMFRTKRAMSDKKFNNEINGLSKMHKLGLGPKFFTSFVVKDFNIHYAFSVMERMHASLKDVLITRPLKNSETILINQSINKMHNLGIIHGDMKPSNMGVLFKKIEKKNDFYEEIEFVNFLDTGKIKEKNTMTPTMFQKLKASDWMIYNKHRVKNRQNL